MIDVKQRIKDLDLTLIRKRVAIHNPNWSEAILDQFEVGYRNFLYECSLNIDTGTKLLKGIDEFWHAHILHTKKYTEDCKRIFGVYLHHTPVDIKPETLRTY